MAGRTSVGGIPALMFDNVLQRDTAVETYKTGAKLCCNGGQNSSRATQWLIARRVCAIPERLPRQPTVFDGVEPGAPSSLNGACCHPRRCNLCTPALRALIYNTNAAANVCVFVWVLLQSNGAQTEAYDPIIPQQTKNSLKINKKETQKEIYGMNMILMNTQTHCGMRKINR